MAELWSEIEKYLIRDIEPSVSRASAKATLGKEPASTRIGAAQQVTTDRWGRTSTDRAASIASASATLAPDQGVRDEQATHPQTVKSYTANENGDVAATLEVDDSHGNGESLPFMDETELQELEGLKRRYIVGKIAGRDLFEEGGQRLVAQGEVITTAILRRAESAGRLLELILHMTIPDGGDSTRD